MLLDVLPSETHELFVVRTLEVVAARTFDRTHLLPPCFVGLDGGAARTELLSLAARVLERRARVRLDQITCLDPFEAVTLEEPTVLCLQQSPGNSAGPEVDVSAAFR
jgi:hypothetical protein